MAKLVPGLAAAAGDNDVAVGGGDAVALDAHWVSAAVILGALPLHRRSGYGTLEDGGFLVGGDICGFPGSLIFRYRALPLCPRRWY